MEPIAVYKVVGGYTVTLFLNRLEITQKLLGANLNSQNKTIPIKSITAFEIPLGKRPQIRTIDGRLIVLNLNPGQAKELKARLAELV